MNLSLYDATNALLSALKQSQCGRRQRVTLAEKLFRLWGVEKIQLIGHLLVVTKTAEGMWKDLANEIESILTSFDLTQALTPDDVQEKMMLNGKKYEGKGPISYRHANQSWRCGARRVRWEW